MDLPPPVQDPEQRDDPADPARRLAAVEAELIALGARVERLEAAVQQTVRDETRRASNEIRHTVSELGRRLALDLPQFLDRHRQLIVGELRGTGGTPVAAPSASPGDPSATPTSASAAPSPTAGADGDGPSDADGGDGDDDGPGAGAETGGGRRRRRRGRKDG